MAATSIVPAAMKHGGRHHQDRRIHKQSHRQRQRRIDVGHLDRFALPFGRALVAAALHDRGMQVQVVRHHRGAQHADGDEEHLGFSDNRSRRHEQIVQRRRVLGPRKHHLDREQRQDGADQRDDQRLNIAESPALQQKDQQHVQPGDQHAIEKRKVKEELQSNRRTNDFGHIAGRDGDLGHEPENPADRAVSYSRGTAGQDRARLRRPVSETGSGAEWPSGSRP